ncbi:MAG: GNAT family N-acetyltransferase [Rhodobacterales bacterium]|jgi:RimJ/RimL family protein N-acetyltransferase|nr:GNAT family N-acetyltransferase [Rhodobacterales bacterium]
MIAAQPSDQSAIMLFLRRHLETSLFPIANLIAHGMTGGHDRAMRFWLDGRPIRGLIGKTEAGMIMPQWPLCMMPDLTPLSGFTAIGLIGDAEQVRRLGSALGLSDAPTQLAADEPLFTLTLTDLLTPPHDPALALHPLTAAPLDLLRDWRCAYLQETTGTPADKAPAIAAQDIDSYIANDSHRVLLRDGIPVAMTGFNARLPDTVQIGGVWTPPALRGQHLARTALALHLTEARAAGVSRAILFAASKSAARAYCAIGFRQIGTLNVTLFDAPQEIRPV